MAPGWCSHTSRRRCPGSSSALHSIGANLPLESGAGGSERIKGNVLIYMHGLSMLSQVVETRESALAMALEGSFASVFSIVRNPNFCQLPQTRKFKPRPVLVG